MPTKVTLATNDELADFSRSLADAKITDPRAKAQMIRDFGEKFTPETADSYVVLLLDEHPEFRGGERNPLGEHSELIERAFTGGPGGKGHVDARGALVKTIGTTAADEASRRFGLRSVSDWTRK